MFYGRNRLHDGRVLKRFIVLIIWRVKMKAKEIVKRFVENERGLETVEYAVILGLILVATIAAVTTLGAWVRDQFTAVNTAVKAADPPA